MPTMVSSWSLYIPDACGCNALVRDNAQAVTDVPHSGTRHFRRFTVRKQHGKQQPRCSTEKNVQHIAAFHTMRTHRTDERQSAPPHAQTCVVGGHRDGLASCALAIANES